MEHQRIKGRVLAGSKDQDSAAEKDAIALSVGAVLVWPALFFMIGGDHEAELSQLKGEYEALDQTRIAKSCDLSKVEKVAQVKKDI